MSVAKDEKDGKNGERVAKDEKVWQKFKLRWQS